MKKTNTSLVLVVLGVAIVAGAVLFIGGGGNYFTFAGNTFEPEYPFAVQDKIYQPVWGTINCQETGSSTAVAQPKPYDCFVNYACVDYKCEYIGGCKIRSIDGDCPWGSGFHYMLYIGDTKYTLPLVLDYGQTVGIRGVCLMATIPRTPRAVDVDIVGKQTKLYITSFGYTRAGWLAGSDNCKLVSVDAATLRYMQDKNDDELKGVEQIPMGVTKNIIVGWREDPAFGTINTCGKYNNQDVVCKPYQGIYSLDKVYTEGGDIYGKNYWTAGSIILSYAHDNTMCCCAGDCAAGYTCENYQCKKDAVVCQHGQCPWGVSQCENLGGCFQEGGRFYLRQAYCDGDKCCQYTEQEVMCCRDFCDAMSTATQSFYCDYDKGCEEVTFEKQCPTGCCCLPGGEYKVQNCLPGKECCMELSNAYMGICKDQCGGIPPEPPESDESCYQNCIAENDCTVGITASGMMCQTQCKVICWIYEHLVYLLIGGGVIVLWFGFKTFKRVSPHARMVSMAYKTVKRK